MLVRDVMSVKPSYCTLHWTVEAVAALMDHAGTGIVPVVEELLHRKLVGVVTDRDLCLRVVAPGKYMTANPTVCHPDDPVEIALQLMADKRVRRLPVTDENLSLQGMLSVSDFVRCDWLDTATIYHVLKEISHRSRVPTRVSTAA